MIKITCDMCGAEIEMADVQALIFDDLIEDREMLQLCPTCRDQVREYIARMRKMIEEPLPPAEELLKKAEKKRKPIDKGKVMALHKRRMAGAQDRGRDGVHILLYPQDHY